MPEMDIHQEMAYNRLDRARLHPDQESFTVPKAPRFTVYLLSPLCTSECPGMLYTIAYKCGLLEV